jgi:diguanylate cyclase (GGDEF)-like protein
MTEIVSLTPAAVLALCAGGAICLAIGRDVKRAARYREKVSELLRFDPLTGLPNRTLLRERLDAALAGAARGERQVGLIQLGLDSFRDVNDVLGHACGDRLLAEMAKRLVRGISPGDTVARLSADEFAIVVSFADEDFDLAFVASRFLVALSGPAIIDGREVFVTASIGVARYPKDAREASELLRFADAAMLSAKKRGGNRFCFHDAQAARAAAERMELGHALRAAREQGELALLFQPVVGLPDGRLLGAEALLRWDHPTRGRLTPDQFIGVAEANGTIVEIGEWVLVKACECAVRWNALSAVALRVSVNVSARQFVMNEFAQTVREALTSTGCAPQWLTVEITESLLLEDNFQVRRTLEDLSRLGVAIAIDDFGTGYSAMSYLRKFPIDLLKIDRSFVRDLEADAKMLALVKAIISVAGALSLDVVAEGIETKAQADALAVLGCGKAQGYWFGRPMPAESFDQRLEMALH